MDTSAIVISASCAAAAGFGVMMGGRLFSVLIARRRELANLQPADHDPINRDTDESEMVALTKLRARTSSIIGLYRDALRHTDGAFTRAYHVELTPTVFSDDLAIEGRCDAFARMLAARKPIGTIIQFRLTAGLDPGRAIATHESARDRASVHYDASLLHDGGIAGYQVMADLGCFRQTKLTVWVRVPNPHRRADDQFLPTFKREIETRGLAGLLVALASSWRAASGEQVARRLLDEEAAAFEEAEKTFRLIERECPIKLAPFTRDEFWAAVFLGHKQNATSVPILPYDGTDLRDYLCGETIEASGQYLMHGNCPAALISMFTPPQPLITADALRLLSVNGSLNFRHTIVSEFVYPDQRQAVKRLDRRISHVGRSAQSLTGKHKFSPEAQVALEDLARLRQDLAGGRAALAQVQFFVVVYGEPVRTRAELAASLKNLDRRCEQVISEIRKIPGADADREEPAALRALYGRALVGEADARKTGREIIETAHSLAPLIPTESEWEGAPRPHTLFSLPTGKLIGIDLFDRQLIPSPLALALAAPRGGKNVLLGRLINDVLATKAHACVRAVDFGESFGPLVDVLGGRHLRFQPGTDKTINVWDYDGLENGELPDETQVGFVVAIGEARQNTSRDFHTLLIT